MERLTKNQRTTLFQLCRRSTRARPAAYRKDNWIDLRSFGRHGTCQHLVDKGYAEFESCRGERGGQYFRVRPTPAALELWRKFCPGSRAPWGFGTGAPICPTCHRGPASLGVAHPNRAGARFAGEVPEHEPRESPTTTEGENPWPPK